MRFCIQERLIGVIAGEVGVGKTVALRAATSWLDPTAYQIIYRVRTCGTTLRGRSADPTGSPPFCGRPGPPGAGTIRSSVTTNFPEPVEVWVRVRGVIDGDLIIEDPVARQAFEETRGLLESPGLAVRRQGTGAGGSGLPQPDFFQLALHIEPVLSDLSMLVFLVSASIRATIAAYKFVRRTRVA